MSTTPYNAPLQMSEIILRTSRFDDVKSWYQKFFGDLKPAVETDTQRKMTSVPHIQRLCFLRIHVAFPYTQVLGIFEVPQAHAAQDMHAGLDHMQFRELSLENLFGRYEMLKKQGVLPTHCFNHGPGTSFYYKDPDGNVVELSAVNFDTEADYLAFFQTEAYRRNIEGRPVEPERYIAEQRAARATAGAAA